MILQKAFKVIFIITGYSGSLLTYQILFYKVYQLHTFLRLETISLYKPTTTLLSHGYVIPQLPKHRCAQADKTLVCMEFPCLSFKSDLPEGCLDTRMPCTAVHAIPKVMDSTLTSIEVGLHCSIVFSKPKLGTRRATPQLGGNLTLV